MDVYNLSSFSLSDNKSTIIWKNLKVAVTEKKEIGADLVKLYKTHFKNKLFLKFINSPT